MKKQQFRQIIKECIKEIRENWDAYYDPQSDTFASGPRDRLSGEEDNLGISEFPQAIIKSHNMDGQKRWFVYSSSNPTALILGYGKSPENAIHNAKTTSGFIKNGGVGHTGELK